MYTHEQLRRAYLAERKRQQGNRAAQQRAYREYRRGLGTIALHDTLVRQFDGKATLLYMPMYWPRWMMADFQATMRDLSGVR
jgi:hypothetical protein